MRAPFQILVFLYRLTTQGQFEFAVFQRADAGFWQGLAGGGEDAETPLEAARRETFEETGLDLAEGWLALDTCASIPATAFREACLWGAAVSVIPEYCFGVEAQDAEVVLSDEHIALAWLPYQDACDCLKFDSNRTALWELRERLRKTQQLGSSPCTAGLF